MSMDPMTGDGEWSFLTSACSAGLLGKDTRGIDQSPIRWKSLLGRAETHGVLPLLYRFLSGVKDSIPRSDLLAVEEKYQTNLLKAMFLSRELIRILDCFDSIRAEVLPYKGVALAEAIYGDMALRQAGDIDLLIRQKDLPRVREELGRIGYKPNLQLSDIEERAYLKSGYECAFDGSAGRNLVEVQWAIQPRFYSVDYDMDDLFARAVTASVAGRRVKVPSAEDLFLILSVHAAKHVWERLIWLCDLVRIMNIPTLDWNWIASEANRIGVARILHVSLLLAERTLNAPIPAKADRCLPPDPAAKRLTDEIQTYIIGNRRLSVESVDYFRLMMRLRERRADRLRFLGRLAFTPGPSEWSTIHLPNSLFPLYRIVRLSRLASRFAGTRMNHSERPLTKTVA
jgi:hypothetical protein